MGLQAATSPSRAWEGHLCHAGARLSRHTALGVSTHLSQGQAGETEQPKNGKATFDWKLPEGEGVLDLKSGDGDQVSAQPNCAFLVRPMKTLLASVSTPLKWERGEKIEINIPIISSESQCEDQ